MQHESGATQGPEALAISAAIAAGTVLFVLVIAGWQRANEPHAAAFFDPLNFLILATQALDGSTTWVGVTNPFGLDIPPFQETVFISALVIETFGGWVYYVLKIVLGIGVVLTLSVAGEGAQRARDSYLLLFVQLALVVIGAIPVFNNTANFLLAL